jgi:hypothetical protein
MREFGDCAWGNDCEGHQQREAEHETLEQSHDGCPPEAKGCFGKTVDTQPVMAMTSTRRLTGEYGLRGLRSMSGPKPWATRRPESMPP